LPFLITNANRAYRIADHYRARGAFVAMGGLHVTSLPDEAAAHADAGFLGPAEQTFPRGRSVVLHERVDDALAEISRLRDAHLAPVRHTARRLSDALA
jgi:hypothetical protein